MGFESGDVDMKIGIHTMVILPGVESKDFERIMIEEVFQVTANLPGSVNRGGISTIKSQHLLKDEADDRRYLWLIKDSEALSSRSTPEWIHGMYDSVQEKLGAICKLESSNSFDIMDGFEIGQRDSLGCPFQSHRTGREL
jgi:hypothetical protein